MEKHQIIIDLEGNPTITVQGVKGRSCQDATRAIELALGKTAADKPTPEMFEAEVQRVKA